MKTEITSSTIRLLHIWITVIYLNLICRHVNTSTVFSSNVAQHFLNQIEGSMNLSVHPCDDFYEYTCGNWQDIKLVNNVALDRFYLNRIDEFLTKESNNRICSLSSEQKLKDYFQTCMMCGMTNSNNTNNNGLMSRRLRKSCLNKLKTIMQDVLIKIVVENELNTSIDNQILDIVYQTIESLKDAIIEQGYEKNKAWESINRIKICLKNLTQNLDIKYSNLHIDRKSCSSLDIDNFSGADSSTQNAFNFLPYTANVTYDHRVNLLHIPWQIFYHPKFNLFMPQFLLYSFIGSIVARQIILNLDEVFRTDTNWINNSTNIYEQNVKCFANYFHNDFTIRRRLGLRGGVIISFRAYKNFLRENPNTERDWNQFLLRKLHSSEQLFFINIMQSYCTTKMMFNNIFNPEYMFRKQRANKFISSISDFQDTFECNKKHYLGTAVNCKMW